MRIGENDLKGSLIRRRGLSYARSVKSISASIDRSEARSNRMGWILALFVATGIVLLMYSPSAARAAQAPAHCPKISS